MKIIKIETGEGNTLYINELSIKEILVNRYGKVTIFYVDGILEHDIISFRVTSSETMARELQDNIRWTND